MPTAFYPRSAIGRLCRAVSRTILDSDSPAHMRVIALECQSLRRADSSVQSTPQWGHTGSRAAPTFGPRYLHAPHASHAAPTYATAGSRSLDTGIASPLHDSAQERVHRVRDLGGPGDRLRAARDRRQKLLR